MMKRPTEHAPVLAAFVAVYLIWGSTYGAIAIAVQQLPPFFLAATRWILAGSLLYGALRCRGVRSPTWLEWKRGFVAGAFLILGGNGLVCWAETTMDSGAVATLQAISPLSVVLIDWLFYGARRPRLRTWIGLVAGFGGVLILVGPTESAAYGAVFAVLLAGLCWALGALYVRYSPSPASVQMSSATQMIGGGVLLAMTSGALGESVPTEVSLGAGLALAYLVLFGSLIGFGAYVYLVRRVSAGAAATHAFVNPVIAVLLGWAALGETIDARALLAAGLIVVAVALIISRERGPRGVPAAAARLPTTPSMAVTPELRRRR